MTDAVSDQVVENVSPKLFKWTWGKSYLALPRDPIPWLIDKIVPAGGLMNLYSQPKVGKSFLALGFALAVSNPDIDNWAGQKVLKHGPVLYLQVDTPRNQWGERIEKIVNAGHDISRIAFVDALLTPYPLDINVQAIKEALKADIAEIKPVLLVVDTLRESHDGDENDSKEMKRVITSIIECTKDTNTACLVVTHSRKDNGFDKKGKGGGAGKSEADDDIGMMDDTRGSSYVNGRMDVVSKLTPKGLRLKGRSIGSNKLSLEQNPQTQLWEPNAEKAESEANLKHVCTQKGLKQRAMAELLVAMEPELSIETARSRVRRWIDKNGGPTSD